MRNQVLWDPNNTLWAAGTCKIVEFLSVAVFGNQQHCPQKPWNSHARPTGHYWKSPWSIAFGALFASIAIYPINRYKPDDRHSEAASQATRSTIRCAFLSLLMTAPNELFRFSLWAFLLKFLLSEQYREGNKRGYFMLRGGLRGDLAPYAWSHNSGEEPLGICTGKKWHNSGEEVVRVPTGNRTHTRSTREVLILSSNMGSELMI